MPNSNKSASGDKLRGKPTIGAREAVDKITMRHKSLRGKSPWEMIRDDIVALRQLMDDQQARGSPQ